MRGRRVSVLPGYFRPEKEWDLVLIQGGHLAAAIELKSHVGPSFGNNFNNRAEEALGSADDLWTAHREGAFGSPRAPWVGYFLLLEDHAKSRRPVKPAEPIFDVLTEFKSASYVDRYEILLRRMMLERRYTATTLVTSTDPSEGPLSVREPVPDLAFNAWLRSLLGHLQSY